MSSFNHEKTDRCQEFCSLCSEREEIKTLQKLLSAHCMFEAETIEDLWQTYSCDSSASWLIVSRGSFDYFIEWLNDKLDFWQGRSKDFEFKSRYNEKNPN